MLATKMMLGFKPLQLTEAPPRLLCLCLDASSLALLLFWLRTFQPGFNEAIRPASRVALIEALSLAATSF